MILDEMRNFHPKGIGRIRVGKPTYILAFQSLNEPIIESKNTRNKRKNLRHNEKIVKVIDTKIMIQLKDENGEFSLKGNKAEFKDKNLILPNHLFSEIVIKKRIKKG